ncbi:hypothetical protein Hdeb2414_s0342g00872291 [Helianthus debilis subsp. tardiflorus]
MRYNPFIYILFIIFFISDVSMCHIQFSWSKIFELFTMGKHDTPSLLIFVGLATILIFIYVY